MRLKQREITKARRDQFSYKKYYPTQNMFIVPLLLNILQVWHSWHFFLVKFCGKDQPIRENIFTKNVRFYDIRII